MRKAKKKEGGGKRSVWIKANTDQRTLPPKSLEIAVFAEFPGTTDSISVCKTETQVRNTLLGVMRCHLLHPALKLLMICNSITRDPHFPETAELQVVFFLSSVPAAGSPAVSDSAQRCHHRYLSPAWLQTLEGRTADACLRYELNAVYDRSLMELAALFFFFLPGGSPTAAWSSPPYRSNKAAFESAVPLLSRRVFMHSRPSNNACSCQKLLMRALFWAHNRFKRSEKGRGGDFNRSS